MSVWHKIRELTPQQHHNMSDLEWTSLEQDHDCCHPAVQKLDNSLPAEQRFCFNIDISADQFYSGRSDCFPFTRQSGEHSGEILCLDWFMHA